MNANEEYLSPEMRDWLDSFMREIEELPGPGPDGREDRSGYRGEIISLSFKFRCDIRNVAHPVFCIISSGIFGDRVFPCLKLVLQLARATGMSPAVSTNLVTALVALGIMDIEKIGEPVANQVLSHADFRPAPKLPPADTG